MGSSNDSDSDSDSYYDRMMAAAAEEDDKIEEGGGEAYPPLEDLSDEQYYAAQEETGSLSAVAAEKDLVWQSFMAEASSIASSTQKREGTLVKVPNDSLADNMLIVEFLFSQLPASSSLFHLVKDVANHSEDIGSDDLQLYHTYTDDILRPTIVVCIRDKPADLSVCLHTSSDTIDFDHAVSVAKILKRMAVAGSSTGEKEEEKEKEKEKGEGRRICYMALDATHRDVVTHAMEQCGSGYKWAEPAALFSLHTTATVTATATIDNNNSELPVGYSMVEGAFTDTDAELVNGTWKYRSDTSLTMVHRMLKRMPCAGVRDTETGALVAWCLTYTGDRSIGMMYTQPEHRSKGLGRAVASAVIRQVVARKEGTSPFCYIVSGNEASVRIFKDALGFEKVIDTFWVGYSTFE